MSDGTNAVDSKLAKAKLISDDGGTSDITLEGKKAAVQLQPG